MGIDKIKHLLVQLDGRAAVWLDGDLKRDVAGEEFRQDHIAKIAAWITANPGVKLFAYLVPEPTNPHDGNAVQVWICGGQVGYLPRYFAALWQSAITDLCTKYSTHVACAAELELPAPADWVTGQAIQVTLSLPWLPDDSPSAPSPSKRGPGRPKREGIKIGVAELVFSMGCPQCKRLSRMTFDEVKIGKPCVCSCGRKIAYDSNDVKSAVDEMKDMATILKIESKKHG